MAAGSRAASVGEALAEKVGRKGGSRKGGPKRCRKGAKRCQEPFSPGLTHDDRPSSARAGRAGCSSGCARRRLLWENRARRHAGSATPSVHQHPGSAPPARSPRRSVRRARPRRCADSPARARSAVTASSGSRVRSRITCQRIEGSESSNQSTTITALASPPLHTCPNQRTLQVNGSFLGARLEQSFDGKYSYHLLD